MRLGDDTDGEGVASGAENVGVGDMGIRREISCSGVIVCCDVELGAVGVSPSSSSDSEYSSSSIRKGSGTSGSTRSACGIEGFTSELWAGGCSPSASDCSTDTVEGARSTGAETSSDDVILVAGGCCKLSDSVLMLSMDDSDEWADEDASEFDLSMLSRLTSFTRWSPSKLCAKVSLLYPDLGDAGLVRGVDKWWAMSTKGKRAEAGMVEATK